MSFFIYANDTNVIMSHHDLDQLISSIDIELSNLSLWFEVNKLSLNVSKTNYMIFKNRHSNRFKVCWQGRYTVVGVYVYTMSGL